MNTTRRLLKSAEAVRNRAMDYGAALARFQDCPEREDLFGAEERAVRRLHNAERAFLRCAKQNEED
jgi:hypothetical protein